MELFCVRQSFDETIMPSDLSKDRTAEDVEEVISVRQLSPFGRAVLNRFDQLGHRFSVAPNPFENKD